MTVVDKIYGFSSITAGNFRNFDFPASIDTFKLFSETIGGRL